jgi:hypothetical protein
MIIEIRKCSRCNSIVKLPVHLKDFEEYITQRKLFKRFHFCADNKGIGLEMIIAIEAEERIEDVITKRNGSTNS